jgi:hypothetical protein
VSGRVRSPARRGESRRAPAKTQIPEMQLRAAPAQSPYPLQPGTRNFHTSRQPTNLANGGRLFGLAEALGRTEA